MNEGPVKPTNSPNEQERKRRLQKLMLPMGLFAVGFILAFLSFTLEVSHAVSIIMMTAGGLCWGIAVALSMIVILPMTQMQQQGSPSKEQMQKSQAKIKVLSIAAVIFFTALMFAASLMIFTSQ